MIGVFDSGHGGLTIYRALSQRFPSARFLYLGDHDNAPYGNRPSDEIIALTREGVERLFDQGCRLVILACNTATAIACRTLQQTWLPQAGWQDCNILGVVAPMVEAATQTPWAVTTPQYPQKYNTDIVAIFGTTRTIHSDVYTEEILKRCPKAGVLQQACPDLAGAIERGETEATLDALVSSYVEELLAEAAPRVPHWAILGCTHYPLVEPHFRRYLPTATRLLSQPEVVADSLEDYLTRHPHYLTEAGDADETGLLTTGDASEVARTVKPFWSDALAFRTIA